MNALSARERQCLDGLARGLTNAEIGAELWLSINTVKTHLQKLRFRAGARNAAHLVALAFEAGLLPIDTERSAA